MTNVDVDSKKSTAPRWDLDSIFPGGSGSKEYEKFRSDLRRDLTAARETIDKLPRKIDANSKADWKKAILEFQRLAQHLDLAASFARCLISQDVTDDRAGITLDEIQVMGADWEGIRNALEGFFLEIDDGAWKVFLVEPEINSIAFFLDEMRTNVKEKMKPELEDLALELAVNGYHAWNRLYDKMSGELQVTFEQDGKKEALSMGQLQNKLLHPDRKVRKAAFQQFQGAWETRAGLAASALNSQAGFRLSLYRRRGWPSALHEPLRMGRMKKETLETMWDTVASALPQMSRYIAAKKKVLGIDKFCWYDQAAPVGELKMSFTFDKAGEFIVRYLGSFSQEMAEFSRMALDKRWVEAEDRPGKADGGYCVSMNMVGQSRIFMTYGDDFGSMTTLAHELGHAYHQWTLKDTPHLVAQYPMGLAETASIFNELRVTDAALQEVDDNEQRLMLLDQILQQPFVLFCNLYARYIFDCRFYERRADGALSKAELDELMVKAQKQAFGDILDPEEGHHPLFWASKQHFFVTEYPFYNFPYTFGYLFAGGVYAQALKEGSAFAPKYRALLQDTGRMTTEEVAAKHLGVDLTKPDFWREAVERSVAYVADFEKLVEQVS
jgi:oligoendopeptidase F